MSFKQGKLVEEKFSNYFDTVIWATEEEDIHEHWDFKVELTNNCWIKYDVKALKKIQRHHKNTEENIHWVELKNVNGKLGWLYGKCDKFAFELEEYFLIVDKVKLQHFIKEKCVNKILTKTPELYKFYKRNNREDLLTLVKTLDLMLIADELIEKKTGNKITITCG